MNQPAYTFRLSTGQMIHKWVLLRKFPYRKKEAVNKRLVWWARCVCGKEMEVPEYYILRPGPKTDCGCRKPESLVAKYNLAYRSWQMMHQRCYNKTHVAFKHYGGRGIHVCPEWHKDNPDGKGFERFVAFMGERPSEKLSLDRIHNDGSYYPYWKDGINLSQFVEGAKRQCKWSTAEEQRANQREPQRKVG